MKSWYAARSGRLQEYKALAGLEAKGIEVFLPRMPTDHPRRGHDDVPLFPSYLFVHHDLSGNGAALVHSAIPTVRLVTFGEVVPSVPDAALDELKRRVAEIAQSGGLTKHYEAGDPIAVTMGGTELFGSVVQAGTAPRARVRLLVEFLGGLVEATVPNRQLRTAVRPPRRTRGQGRFIGGLHVAGDRRHRPGVDESS